MAMPTMAAIAKRMTGAANDSKFFSTTKKGETHELRQELANPSREKKKDAVKKVIANMTVGKDVSMLFTDVVNCIQTADTQLKKLVYLYLINYAKSNPDLTILAVNTFVKDAADPNPLIRALSVRTMGCIRVDRITEYLCEPLRRCLQDEDPYVRKTAAICVSKLYDINPDMVEEQGFLDMLRDLISDSNPTVVANAIAALSEISENSGGAMAFKITKSVLQKLLAALNECNEWGQVFVLDALASYTPADSREAEGIIERVTPRLQHANSAVVLSAVKVIMKFVEKVSDADTERSLSRKMAPPLVTLLSAEPEIQYVALRNINLIVQKRPGILANEIKVFFCKYNDPIYVKMEKLEIIIRLVSERNIEQVLLEFKEYATEVDVEFVRRSVRAIGRCAVKLERAAEKCINVLLELIQTKVNYIVQEAIIVIKDIFRKYPNQYESIIATLCENLDTLDEPEAKASMIWIIGEYAERIDNADELLESFMDSFDDETAQVQLQLLTATVKLFLKRPNETQEMVQKVLHKATEESDNPDLRDRGYVYWRLLSANPEAAHAVVLAEKPVISDDTFALESSVLDDLIGKISTLASVYHKVPSAFVVRSTVSELREHRQDDDHSNEDDDEGSSDQPEEGSSGLQSEGAIDLLDMGGLSMGGSGPAPTAPAPASASLKLLMSAQQGKGLQMTGAFTRRDGNFVLDVDFENQASAPIAGVSIQFNKSTFGVVPMQATVTFPQPLTQGQKVNQIVPMSVSPQFVNAAVAPNLNMQVAIKNNSSGEVVYFQSELELAAIFTEAGGMASTEFISMWQSIAEANEHYFTLATGGRGVDAVSERLGRSNVFYVAKRPIDGKEVAYFSVKTMTNVVALFELTFDNSGTTKVCLKLEQKVFSALLQQTMERLLA
ncbi:AP-2 complex subunit beta, putative [Phytophthora infestans T30-4]|uniref:AP-2 complex subunit beta, putative n=1 Tax=Phytophthora infestans (strain T30-4) TaxID=403677 RepID=D0N5X1_PHYIT|nr:AP-2 complex subunit beta, putative [Phytophthora infestans T30-4]EEY70462.1 AP-2 complex subunit beta, putative [Phytophthora infestans T30-4]|eukprot:XP_002998116.1 AP-2 complex subunit beta, putative [Phytophthora infestans T30-4]